jgi:multidrug efflux pump subunit AcrB
MCVPLCDSRLDSLKQLGEQLRVILSALPGVLHTRMTQDAAKPKIWVDIREEEAQLAGLRLHDVAAQLRDALSGSIQGSVVESNEQLPMRLRITDDERGLYRNFASTQLVSASSSQMGTLTNIPLSSLGGCGWCSGLIAGNGLGFQEFMQSVQAPFPAIAGLLVTAKRRC